MAALLKERSNVHISYGLQGTFAGSYVAGPSLESLRRALNCSPVVSVSWEVEPPLDSNFYYTDVDFEATSAEVEKLFSSEEFDHASPGFDPVAAQLIFGSHPQLSADDELVHESLGAVAWSIGEAARSHPAMVFRLRSLLSLEALVRDVNSFAHAGKGRRLRVKSSVACYQDFLAPAGLHLVIMPRRLVTVSISDGVLAEQPLSLATSSDLETTLHLVRKDSKLGDVALRARGGPMGKVLRRREVSLDNVTAYQLLLHLAMTEHCLAIQSVGAGAFPGGESPWQEVEAVADTIPAVI